MRPPSRSLIPVRDSYEAVCRDFVWRIPPRFNIAEAVCTRHARATPDRLAIVHEDAAGHRHDWTFLQLERLTARLANTLAALGVVRGDRVAVVLGQGPLCAAAHLAAFKLGAVSLPLAPQFGPEALRHRLQHSGARAVVASGNGCARITELRADLPALEHVLSSDDPAPPGALALPALLERSADTHAGTDTAADDPALLVYTSGTTGLAKGALHAHRVLIGHLPGVEFPLDFFPKSGDRYWTPSDWSWVAGLLNVLLCGLYHRVPVVARRFDRFDPEAALALMARLDVRNALIAPTALKLMRQVARPRRHGYRIRSLCSGGERLGDELIEWGREAFDLTVNEVYGQTECNLAVGYNARVMTPPSGSMGRAIPGHQVAILDAAGHELDPGTPGLIAVRRPHPVMLLQYWRDPEATADKFLGDWLVTGDHGRRDEHGYLWFEGRDDDLINSAGYRIGPVEIEECLLGHPAVAMAGVVGKPDPLRGEIVVAFVAAATGHTPSEALARELTGYVRDRLSAHEYPREIAFIDEMPLTVSGKVRRMELRRLASTGLKKARGLDRRAHRTR